MQAYDTRSLGDQACDLFGAPAAVLTGASDSPYDRPFAFARAARFVATHGLCRRVANVTRAGARGDQSTRDDYNYNEAEKALALLVDEAGGLLVATPRQQKNEFRLATVVTDKTRELRLYNRGRGAEAAGLSPIPTASARGANCGGGRSSAQAVALALRELATNAG